MCHVRWFYGLVIVIDRLCIALSLKPVVDVCIYVLLWMYQACAMCLGKSVRAPCKGGEGGKSCCLPTGTLEASYAIHVLAVSRMQKLERTNAAFFARSAHRRQGFLRSSMLLFRRAVPKFGAHRFCNGVARRCRKPRDGGLKRQVPAVHELDRADQ